MGDFGTGLRDRLEGPVACEPLRVERSDAGLAREVELERKRLAKLAAELELRELELAQREADLEAAAERLALGIARAFVDAALQANVPPHLDELALARIKRDRVA